MKAYSTDLRERIVGAVEGGMPKAEAARTFRVALSTVKLYVARKEQTGSLQARTSPGRPRSITPAQHPALDAQLRAHPDQTVAEHAARWAREQRQPVGVDALRRAIRRLQWRFTKKRWWPPSATTPAARTGAHLGRGDEHRRLLRLRAGLSRPEPAPGANRPARQPECPPRRGRPGVDRGPGLSGPLPAAVFPGLLADRAGLRQTQGVPAPDRGPHPGGARRCDPRGG